MKKRTLNLSIFVFGGILLFASCKKETEKEVGNTKMTTTAVTTVNGWYTNYNDGTDFEFQTNVSVPEITADVVSNGTVLAFVQDDATSSFVALPYSFSYSDYSLHLNYAYKSGTVILKAEGYDFSIAPDPADLNGMKFKFVVLSKLQIAANPHIDFTDYEQVMSIQ